MISDGMQYQRIVQIDFRHRIAVLESAIPNGLHGSRHLERKKILTHIKGMVSDRSQTTCVWYIDIGNPGTVVKSMVADDLQAVAQRNLLQSSAVVERVISDTQQFGGYHQFLDISVVGKDALGIPAVHHLRRDPLGGIQIAVRILFQNLVADIGHFYIRDPLLVGIGGLLVEPSRRRSDIARAVVIVSQTVIGILFTGFVGIIPQYIELILAQFQPALILGAVVARVILRVRFGSALVIHLYGSGIRLPQRVSVGIRILHFFVGDGICYKAPVRSLFVDRDPDAVRVALPLVNRH